MFRLVSLLIGYAFGLIQMAYIVGRFRGIDIREHGSGNSGTTNAIRTMGAKAGTIVFVVDMAKAILAFLIAGMIFEQNHDIAGMYAGFGAILGHCFPFFLKFKGGKGVACYVGIILVIQLTMGLSILAIGASLLIFTKYMSITSLVMAGITPIFLYVWRFSGEIIIVSIFSAIICFVMHRSNIKRLLLGTELQVFGNKNEE